MKYKLTKTERAERIEARAKARADKAARLETFRDWFEARRLAAAKRAKERAEQVRATGGRGVDRVPARYQVTRPAPEYVAEHTAANRAERRAWALGQGRSMPAAANVPHINPARDKKRGARLRKAG